MLKCADGEQWMVCRAVTGIGTAERTIGSPLTKTAFPFLGAPFWIAAVVGLNLSVVTDSVQVGAGVRPGWGRPGTFSWPRCRYGERWWQVLTRNSGT